MKLDSRIKSLSDVLTYFDVESARQFIGQKGYFAGDLYCFCDLLRCPYGTLENLFDDMDDTFQSGEILYPFFIPECFLKPKENLQGLKGIIHDARLLQSRLHAWMLHIVGGGENDVNLFACMRQYPLLKDVNDHIAAAICEMYELNEEIKRREGK